MAPSASSRARAEAEYGVAFEFPNLSLHSAAANGNIGLVKYALSNGQPANAVLNGVLPIHAASASGYETIVRMLIESGANVNSPRLSRRLSNDKTRGAGLTVGTAGSTPLHFAAAMGRIPVIELLLACGAKPDSVEKLGRTPEQLAIEHGHLVAADLLRTATRNYREGALEEATDEEDETASVTSHSRKMQLKGSMPSPLSPVRKQGPYRLGPSASSSSLRMAGVASASALTNPARRLLSSQGSSDSLSLRTAHAIKDKVRSSSPSTSKLPPAMSHTYSERMVRKGSGDSSSLTAPPTQRRPSLPAVFDRAAHSLGISTSSSTSARPPPLHLSSSSLAHPRMRSGTGSSRTLASVFTRKVDGSTSPGDEGSEWSSTGGSPPLQTASESSSGFPTPRRGMSEEDMRGDQRSYLGLPAPPATAPAHQSNFPSNIQMTSSVSLSQLPSPTIPGTSYRPRKASQLSSNPLTSLTEIRKSSPEHAVADDGDPDVPLSPSQDSLLHRRTSSSTSQKVQSFFGRLSRNSSRRSSFSDKAASTWPSFTSADSGELARREFRESTVKPEGQPENAIVDEATPELVDGDSSEAGDQFPGPMLRGASHARPSNRSRGDSVGSTSSSTSRFTGPASYIGTPSPLAHAASSDHLHPGDAVNGERAKTRTSRSGSTATDPDLRQVALGNATLANGSSNSILSGSPGSTSSAAHSSTHSAHSTAATSAIWSSASTQVSKPDARLGSKARRPTSPATSHSSDPPRTPTGELITPSIAHSLVQKAQQDLLAYDPANSETSLSEQLAALGAKLSMEREVRAAAERSRTGTAAPTPYVWEKLGKDGTRTPVPRSERRTHTPSMMQRGTGHAFQQGSLDRRRPSAPTLRQDFTLHGEAVKHEHGHVHRPSQNAAQREPIYEVARSTGSGPLAVPRVDTAFLAPPVATTETRRRASAESRRPRSIDRRSAEPSSAGSSVIEPPKYSAPTSSTAATRQHRNQRSSPTNVYDDKLDLHRTTSRLSSTTLSGPVAPNTLEGQRPHATGGKFKRLMNSITGR